MSNALAFDTLAYAKRLKEAGVAEREAEVHAEALAEIVNERLATKQDIESLRRDMKEMDTSLRREMKEMDTSLRHEMKEMDTSLKHEMKELEMRLAIRLGGMMAVAVAVVATLVKLL